MTKILSNLGTPKNNTETYLSYLTGRSNIALKDLPKPYTNVDTYLYYLCQNGVPGAGGGTGGGGNFTGQAKDVIYDNTLSALSSDNVQEAIQELEWMIGDLWSMDIEHVDVINGVNVETVEEAIEELKKMTGGGSNIQIATDSVEFKNMYQAGGFKTGDIVFVINSNGVMDYANQDVDNGNKPVAMIYDHNAPTGGFHKFRVFCKYVDKVTINGVDLDGYAKLNGDNIFTGNNSFTNLDVSGVVYDNAYLKGNPSPDGNANRIFGVRSLSSDRFYEGHIESIRYYLHTKNADRISGVNVYAIEKGATVAEDRVHSEIHVGKAFDVKQDAKTGVFYIEIDIDKKFQDTIVYIACRVPGTARSTFKSMTNISSVYNLDYINMSASTLTVGASVSRDGTYCLNTEIRGRLNVKEKLNEAVYTWQDLDGVENYSSINLLDFSSHVFGFYYNELGARVRHDSWNYVNIPVEEGKQYTMLRQYTDSARIALLDADGLPVLPSDETPLNNISGWQRKTITITPGSGVKQIGISFQKGNSFPHHKYMMVIEGEMNSSIGFVPYADKRHIQVKGVSLDFDNTTSVLDATTVQSALEEIAKKFVHKYNSNGQISGKTVFTNAYISSSRVGYVNSGNAQGLATGEVYTCEGLRIPAGQSVSKVVIGVRDSNPINGNVDNVIIGAVRCRDLMTLDYLIEGGSYVVKTNVDTNIACNKAIEVTLDDYRWDEDVYLLIGGTDVIIGKGGNPDGGLGWHYTAPITGEVLHERLNSSAFRGKAVIYSGETSLGNFVGDTVATLMSMGNAYHSEIGEIKTYPVDFGANHTDYEGRYWEKCTGTPLTREFYPEVFEALGVASSINEIQLPTSVAPEFKYICIE